jgi:Flp pilus assembly pilin Flp
LSSSILEQFGRETGQTAAEYAVVLGVITLAIVSTFVLLSGTIQNALERVTGLFS